MNNSFLRQLGTIEMRYILRGFLAVALSLILASFSLAAEREKPRLLVLVVFDQMRGDYPERWQKLYGEGGFARLIKDGVWFNNCHYPYANTQTGPGHSSMLTGCSPDQHGIIANQWYDRKTSAVVNCAESARYQRVPALPKTIEPEVLKEEPKKSEITSTAKAPAKKIAGSPEHLLAPTIGDVLKETSGGKAKVVGLSFKDRSALLPVGRGADAVYWLDSTDGMIVTSSFYRDSVHSWVAEFNKSRIADRWFAKDWTRLLPDVDYEKYSGPDSVVGEGRGAKQGMTFPHPMDGGLKKPGKSYYDALYNSPYGNEFLLELAKKAIVAEELGKDDITDLLVVSFSSNDAIGHTWGPDSQEVLDVTLRSDRIMAEFLTFLDGQVGKGKYVLALTADHGICPLPEVSAKKGLPGKRIPGAKIFAAAEVHLHSEFDKQPVDPKSKARWIESVQPPWVYLNHDLIETRGLKKAVVAKSLSDFLGKQEGIYRVFTRDDLANEFPVSDPIGQRMKRSYYPDRSGDIGFVISPYCLLETTLTGTNHGSPHAYDTHVPLLVFGSGVASGIHKEPVTPQATAAIFAAAAGVKPPKNAEYPVPAGLFEK